MKSILVLGSTGTVGQELSKLLVASGFEVCAATRDASSHPVEGVTPVGLNLLDQAAFDSALRDIEGLFVMTPPGHAAAHVLLKPFLDRALKLSSLRRVITMSAQGVDADETIPLRQVELQVEGSNVPWIHLRPSWFMQNFHSFWGHSVRQLGQIRLPAEDAQVGFVDTRDIAASAHAAFLAEDGKVAGRAFTLTGPVALTHEEAAEILTQELGRNITYTSISETEFRQDLAPSGLPDDYISLLVNLFAAVRGGSAAQPTSHVQELTGHAPRPLEGYARDFAQWLQPES